MNHVTLTGNLTDDPELRFGPSGKPFVTFTIGNSEYNPNGDPFRNGFFDIVVYGPQAERVAETFAKGDRVLASGRLQQISFGEPDALQWRTRLTAVAVGASLEFESVSVHRKTREAAPSEPAEPVAEAPEKVGAPA